MITRPLFAQHRVTGAPLEGAVVIATACDSINRPRAAPTVEEQGEGLYLATFHAGDEENCTVALFDFGADALERYAIEVVHRNDNTNQAWAVVVIDAAGSLVHALADPTVGAYVWDDGTDRIAQAPATVQLEQLGPVFLWRPTREDAELGASIRVDGPAGGAVPFWTDETSRVVPLGASLGASLFSVLTADAGVTALVGTRIFPDMLPQNEVLPALIYNVITDPLASSLTGATLRSARVQIDAYAKSHKAAAAVQVQVERVMVALREPSPGLSAVQETARGFFDPITGYHRVQMEFNVWR